MLLYLNVFIWNVNFFLKDGKYTRLFFLLWGIVYIVIIIKNFKCKRIIRCLNIKLDFGKDMSVI